MHAQLGFCQGNSGDPIFTETFGVGTQNTSLPAGTTTYTYANNQDPNDGFYTVSSTSNYFDWFSVNDHTPSDTNGRMLIVNSNFAAGEFYKTTINGLCENTTYEFSSWLINLTPPNGFCGAGAIPVNVSFEIWDNTDTTLLASGTTGNIFGTTASDWNQYALVFQSTVGQTSIILKMINNAPGGCGNDLAIDDIVFKSCGDSIDINDGTSNSSITLCSTQTPYSETITAMPDNAVFNNHFYQWQTSTDNVTWTDLSGETNASIGISGIISTTYFRAKVAEYAANLNNADCITFSDVYEIIVNQAPPAPTTACWETATFNDSSCSWSVTGTQPVEPTGLECWELTVFNNITCSWDISGTQPTAPSNLECWETATFDSATCAWVISGNQPTQPTVECWETALFNDVTCTWEVSGTQPLMPTGLACWETATFDDSSCSWTITGTQPMEPTSLECWQTTSFNTTTCLWEINGTQPTAPSNLECWQTATFNDTDCDWEVTGSQPIEPINLECWETATFNDSSCSWSVTGTQPVEPTGLECWELTVFNNITCSWDISGTQPTAPSNLECWETATFDSATCAWVISGNQPTQPAVECWEIAIFNNLTCTWEVSGTQPQMPTGLACWETATFDDSSCSWLVTGTQPVEPTDLECWQTALFNTATCSWDINGTQPTVPSNLECWQTATFNDTDCDWEVTGSQPIEPINLECWETTFFNEDLCQWEVLGTQPIEYREEFLFLCEDQFLDLEATTTINNPNYNWVSGEMTASLTIDTAGDYEVEITGDCLTEIITFNVELIESPEIESIETNGSSIVINVFNEDDHQYSLDGLNYQYSNLFVNKQSGLYTIYVKSISCGTVIEQDYFHFYIQKFITPNGDGKNDFFLLNVSQYFTNSELYIYDRYGKILFSAINRDASWDATFNGKKLPTSDYWYHIILDGMEYRGHFTVKY